MSEYWKSVPRKFCDFCKCWITDNKPSVDFHERGKRHQENVQRRLKEVRKKGYEQSQKQDEMDEQMKKMEKAALEAFKKDLAADPELAKKYGVSLEPKPKPETSEKSDSKKLEGAAEDKEKEWYEAKSSDGYCYYWSTVTGESRWEAPEEFVSIEEQESEQKKDEEADKDTTTAKSEEENFKTERKQTQDPSFTRSAFGAWAVVREESQPVIYDSQSQAPIPEEIPMPEDIPLPNQIPLPKSDGPKFKEKTVKSLGSSSEDGMPTFKKRKIASGARNVRQRANDD